MSDLVDSLVSNLGLDSKDKAEALAGWGIGSVQFELNKTPNGRQLNRKLESSIPNLPKWKAKSNSMLPKNGRVQKKKGGFTCSFTSILPKKAGKNPNGSLGNPMDVMGVLSQLGVDKGKATSVPGTFTSYFKDTLDKDTCSGVLASFSFSTKTGSSGSLDQLKEKKSGLLNSLRSLSGSRKD